MFTPQQQKVIDYIERWGSINSIIAIKKLGITRLAARIHELRNSNRAMKAVTRDNVATGFATYIPDWEARRRNLKSRQLVELMEAKGPRIAEINIKYTAKFAKLNTLEREYQNDHA